MAVNAETAAFPQTGQTGTVVHNAETVQTALVESNDHGPHAEAVSWLGFDATGWVSLAMLILIGIMIWKKVPQLIARSLDSQVSKVRAELDEAARLRAEAEALFSSYQAKADAASRDAEAILATAQEEAQRLVADARTKAEEVIARRSRLAEEKIGAAERAAAEELRARATSLAVEAAREVIASHTDPAVRKTLTDQAINEIDRRLH